MWRLSISLCAAVALALPAAWAGDGFGAGPACVTWGSDGRPQVSEGSCGGYPGAGADEDGIWFCTGPGHCFELSYPDDGDDSEGSVLCDRTTIRDRDVEYCLMP